MVPPDLLETTKRVSARFIRFSASRIVAGSVVSRTMSWRKPGFAPKVSAQTSGHRLLPPIPRRHAVRKPRVRTSSVKRRISPVRPFMSRTTFSHPSERPMIAVWAGSFFHTFGSLAQILLTNDSSDARRSSLSKASWYLPRDSCGFMGDTSQQEYRARLAANLTTTEAAPARDPAGFSQATHFGCERMIKDDRE